MFRKKRYIFPAIFGLLLSAVVLSFGLFRLEAFGQTESAAPSPPQQYTARTAEINRPRLVRHTAATAPAISAAAAAAENVRLKNSLAWTFGGRAQRGWYLYVSLIQQTVQTDADVDAPEFARAVAVWQSGRNVEPTGVVNEDTLFQMIKSWQAARLNSSQAPEPERLFSAPIVEFYDPARGADLLQVERETFAAYKKMIAAAAKDLGLKTTADGELAPEEKFLKIISAYRSREHQARLRAASPNSGRAGLAVNSPHFTGQALDIYVGGDPVSTKDENRAIQVQTPAYKWLVKNAARFGFRPYYYEPWHWEYVPAAAIKN